jgi:hypothetical protein
MAIVNLNELKQRFSDGDMPSAKDFSDLIDTLVSVRNTEIAAGTLPLNVFAPQAPSQVLQTDTSGNITSGTVLLPAVVGDGSLDGVYPGLSIKSDGSSVTSGIQSQHIRNQAVKLQHFNQTEASALPIGSVLTWTGSGFAWQSSTTASGAVRKFKSSLIALPTSVGEYTSGGFVANVAHGLGLIPDTWRVALVCVNTGGSVGYVQNQEVPINLFAGTSGVPVFIPSVSSSHITVTTAFTSVGSGSNYTMTVYRSDIPGQLITLSMGGGDFSKWNLVVYGEVYIAGTGFGSVADWSSAPTSFDHVITPLSIVNGLGTAPTSYSVVLRNITIDGIILEMRSI